LLFSLAICVSGYYNFTATPITLHPRGSLIACYLASFQFLPLPRLRYRSQVCGYHTVPRYMPHAWALPRLTVTPCRWEPPPLLPSLLFLFGRSPFVICTRSALPPFVLCCCDFLTFSCLPMILHCSHTVRTGRTHFATCDIFLRHFHFIAEQYELLHFIYHAHSTTATARTWRACVRVH